ncbi:hypothetical protein AB0M57_35595 [Streptomyces sp. NPDC051597]|uniref:hypothetical protein n=1 Tax=Streptomyces sp. NPDC051597 TaxID=3155049 RepID=UPI003434864E
MSTPAPVVVASDTGRLAAEVSRPVVRAGVQLTVPERKLLGWDWWNPAEAAGATNARRLVAAVRAAADAAVARVYLEELPPNTTPAGGVRPWTPPQAPSRRLAPPVPASEETLFGGSLRYDLGWNKHDQAFLELNLPAMIVRLPRLIALTVKLARQANRRALASGHGRGDRPGAPARPWGSSRPTRSWRTCSRVER